MSIPSSPAEGAVTLVRWKKVTAAGSLVMTYAALTAAGSLVMTYAALTAAGSLVMTIFQ